MGVPRFTKDLALYVQRATLGREGSACESTVEVLTLVLDGPSYAHHVYEKLLGHLLRSATVGLQLPTYEEIGEGALHLLRDFTEQGVKIEAICFDGHVPAAKYKERLARLEDKRQRLEKFRQSNSAPLYQRLVGSALLDYDDALWSRQTFSPRLLPPSPPFLVPAVIEAIRRSPWRNVVHVVPEEADVACARVARSTGAVILSDDSDLTLYDIGSDAVIVQLRSLEKQHSLPGDPMVQITASCIKPHTVATQLQLPSLMRLAYERHLNGKESLASILQKARSPQDDDDAQHFGKFAAEYTICDQNHFCPSLQNLDPRIAEFVVQLFKFTTTSPKVFMTMLFEDHSKDSSWNYGQIFRRLAYTLAARSAHEEAMTTITEHLRRGNRITEEGISLLGASELEHTISSVHEALILMDPVSFRGDTSSFWYCTALSVVIRERLTQGKHITIRDIHRILGLDRARNGLTWDDIHLDANIQAVLYSLRMLKQLLRFMLDQLSDHALLKDVRKLATLLDTMPNLEDVFVDLYQRQALIKTKKLDTTKILKPIVKTFPQITRPIAKSPPTEQRGKLEHKPLRNSSQHHRMGMKLVPAVHRNKFELLSATP